MLGKQGGSGSAILLDEYYGAEDSRFLEELRTIHAPGKLQGLANRWKKDRRPWARAQILAYLDAPLDCPGHHVLVKQLFKHAEEQRDDEVMAAFLVAFDRIVRRKRRMRYIYDASSEQWWEEEFLAHPRNSILPTMSRVYHDPYSGKRITVDIPIGPDSRLFSYHTRHYLRRRVWRYFRHMGYRQPEHYPRALALALMRYRDEDFSSGEHILDNWGLMQACYREHQALEFSSYKVDLKQNRALSELDASPRFPDLWKTRDSMTVLLSLTRNAKSRLVRVWAIELLQRDHAEHLSELGMETILELIDHDDEDVQNFAAHALQSVRGLETTPLTVWLRLIETGSPAALDVVCDVMRRHVTPDRLSLDQMLDIATARPTPVARMGLEFLKARAFESPEDRGALSRLAHANCSTLADELTTFALSFFQTPQTYDREIVSEFFDSILAEIRESAWNTMNPESPAYHDPILWFRLLETPFDDVRLKIVDALKRRAPVSAPDSHELHSLWWSVLLGVHRGGRQKLTAIGQIAGYVIERPERADDLLPMLGAMVRSVRGPEQRAGLSALVNVVDAHPSLTDTVQTMAPELILAPEETEQ